MADEEASDGERAVVRLTFTEKQLRKKFKHASKFGVLDRPSRVGLEAFADALRSHVADADTLVRSGTFRGTLRVVFFVGRTSGLLVMASESGEFISSWRLSETQLRNVLRRGRL